MKTAPTRLVIVLMSSLCLVGCGTVTTLSSSDQRITRKLVNQNTYCESMPRVYSGVSYNLCVLNSKPTNTAVDVIVGFYLIDSVLSAVTDTLVLPYTIYQQQENGSIQIDL